MIKEQAMVAEFHREFGAPPPEALDVERFPGELRIRLIEEEAAEFAQAVRAGDVPEMIDALCDLLFVTYGAAVELGVDLEPFFAAVHRANMAKAGGHRRADGKWIKPAGWQPPDIAGLLRERYGWQPSYRSAGMRPEIPGASPPTVCGQVAAQR
jgi:predicted HAD superfamily Cof-like phosphohydrolase